MNFLETDTRKKYSSKAGMLLRTKKYSSLLSKKAKYCGGGEERGCPEGLSFNYAVKASQWEVPGGLRGWQLRWAEESGESSVCCIWHAPTWKVLPFCLGNTRSCELDSEAQSPPNSVGLLFPTSPDGHKQLCSEESGWCFLKVENSIGRKKAFSFLLSIIAGQGTPESQSEMASDIMSPDHLSSQTHLCGCICFFQLFIY